MALIPISPTSAGMPLSSRQPEATAQKQENVTLIHPSFTPQIPKYRLDEVILPEKTLNSIKNALAIRTMSEKVFNEWGLSETHNHSRKVGINLYGPPGTGKTMVAHAIAHEMNKKLMIINYADIESKYVGDTPKNLTEAFRIATETESILFFDEADAILSRRVTNMNNATDTSVNQTRSVMLTLLNDYQGVILFATNNITNYDPAFMRRIVAHIQFELPDLDCRVRILRSLIPAKMPTDVNVSELASEYDQVSGSDISNAILMAAFAAARLNEHQVSHRHFRAALEDIKKSLAANKGPEVIHFESKPVSEEFVKSQLGSTITGG
ncbi:ATP-binding protein [Paenibacillus sp. WC2504]|uniref:ATP-binding protein n=1 Tax=Paenibacillus sp. WC2504 TaxID=3461403 RepID=UPI00404525A9